MNLSALFLKADRKKVMSSTATQHGLIESAIRIFSMANTFFFPGLELPYVSPTS